MKFKSTKCSFVLHMSDMIDNVLKLEMNHILQSNVVIKKSPISIISLIMVRLTKLQIWPRANIWSKNGMGSIIV